MKKKLTVLEKYEAARKDFLAGKYSSGEIAAKKNGISPATYWNYLKKERLGQTPKPLDTDDLATKVLDRVMDRVVEIVTAKVLAAVSKKI